MIILEFDVIELVNEVISLIMLIDFDFETNVFFHGEPVEEELKEDFGIVLKEERILLQVISVEIFGLIVDDEVIKIVDDISDRLVFKFQKGFLVVGFQLLDFFLLLLILVLLRVHLLRIWLVPHYL